MRIKQCFAHVTTPNSWSVRGRKGFTPSPLIDLCTSEVYRASIPALSRLLLTFVDKFDVIEVCGKLRLEHRVIIIRFCGAVAVWKKTISKVIVYLLPLSSLAEGAKKDVREACLVDANAGEAVLLSLFSRAVSPEPAHDRNRTKNKTKWP